LSGPRACVQSSSASELNKASHVVRSRRFHVSIPRCTTSTFSCDIARSIPLRECRFPCKADSRFSSKAAISLASGLPNPINDTEVRRSTVAIAPGRRDRPLAKQARDEGWFCTGGSTTTVNEEGTVPMRLRIVLAAAAATLTCLLSASAASAATLTVTTTNDETNQNGLCSLREAIVQANSGSAVPLYSGCKAGPAPYTINLAKNAVYTLTIGPALGENEGMAGDLDVSSQVQPERKQRRPSRRPERL